MMVWDDLVSVSVNTREMPNKYLLNESINGLFTVHTCVISLSPHTHTHTHTHTRACMRMHPCGIGSASSKGCGSFKKRIFS